MPFRWVRILFVLSGIYDGLLGIVFAAAPATVYRIAAITPPNHLGYIQFPALLLILFGVMFFSIAANPVSRRELILYGMGLKVSYCAVVFGYALRGEIPALWIPFAYADVLCLILFFLAWRATARAVKY